MVILFLMIKRKKIKHDVRKLFPLLKEKLEQEKDVIFAYIFGSYGMGNEKPLSDVDIAVYLENEDMERELEIVGIITDVLKTDEVDVVFLKRAPLSLAFQVLRTGKLLFSKDERKRIEFETGTRREYWDFRHHREKLIRNYLARVKEEINE